MTDQDERNYDKYLEDGIKPKTPEEVRKMALIGKTILDEPFKDGYLTGLAVMKVAKAIDACNRCNSYIWVESSNEKPRLSIEKLVLYHFGDHI